MTSQSVSTQWSEKKDFSHLFESTDLVETQIIVRVNLHDMGPLKI